MVNFYLEEKMKKIAIFLALLLIPTFSCFAGSFYSNIVVLSVNAENFVPSLLQMGITAYYVLKNNIGVIFEDKIDEQSIEYGAILSKNISTIFNSITVYTTIHDSDVVFMYIYKNGQLIFSYNSAPGYFNGDDLPPQIENIDKLLLEYKDIDKEEFINVLNSNEIFADDLHGDIARILDLPPYSVGFGYTYLNDIDERNYFEEEFNVKVERIGE
jgi:hypothetical protein